MGGRGSGGRRTGAGRKALSDLERAIGGDAGKRGGGVDSNAPAPSTAVAPVGPYDPPTEAQLAPRLAALTSMLEALKTGRAPGAASETRAEDGVEELQARVDEMRDLAREALTVWLELAPHAVAARTLTPATSAAFLMLCRAVVSERTLASSPATAAGPNHRGTQQRVAGWMKDFSIAPLGKPVLSGEPAAAAPVNPLDRFTKTRGA